MNTATEDATSEPAASLALLPRSLSAKTTRSDHLEALLRSLDVTIFLFFGVAYLYDNVTFLLLLHASCQVLYTRSTQLIPTVVASIISTLTHLLNARPEGSKALRGYLHGGLICDFVGELGPISHSRLLLLDITIVGLQLYYLAVSYELDTTKGAESGESETAPQDIESEEAGVRREEQDNSAAQDDGIELQPTLNGVARSQDKHAVTHAQDDDLIVTLDFRRSLSAVFKKNASATLVGSDASNGRIGTLLHRIAAAREAAIRA